MKIQSIKGYLLKLFFLFVFILNIHIDLQEFTLEISRNVQAQVWEDDDEWTDDSDWWDDLINGDGVDVGDGEKWHDMGSFYAVDTDNDGKIDAITWQDESGAWAYKNVDGSDDDFEGTPFTPIEPEDPTDPVDPIDPDDYYYSDNPCDPTSAAYDPCVCYGIGCEEIPAILTRVTPCESANLSNHVYDLSKSLEDPNMKTPPIPGGWELNSTLALPPEFTEQDTTSGFSSALYQKENGQGGYDYMYVTEGTDFTSLADWENNIQQSIGKSSAQYEISIANANILGHMAEKFGFELMFSGHSLGGGLATANALATGYPAVVYNPAGLSQSTINSIEDISDDIGAVNITTYIVEGEIVSSINKALGLQVFGEIIDLHVSQELINDIIGEIDPTGIYNLSSAVTRHFMATILETLKCED